MTLTGWLPTISVSKLVAYPDESICNRASSQNESHRRKNDVSHLASWSRDVGVIEFWAIEGARTCSSADGMLRRDTELFMLPPSDGQCQLAAQIGSMQTKVLCNINIPCIVKIKNRCFDAMTNSSVIFSPETYPTASKCAQRRLV